MFPIGVPYQVLFTSSQTEKAVQRKESLTLLDPVGMNMEGDGRPGHHTFAEEDKKRDPESLQEEYNRRIPQQLKTDEYIRLRNRRTDEKEWQAESIRNREEAHDLIGGD